MPRRMTASELAIEALQKRGITPPKEMLHDAEREEKQVRKELALYNYKDCLGICKAIGAPCSCH